MFYIIRSYQLDRLFRNLLKNKEQLLAPKSKLLERLLQSIRKKFIQLRLLLERLKKKLVQHSKRLLKFQTNQKILKIRIKILKKLHKISTSSSKN